MAAHQHSITAGLDIGNGYVKAAMRGADGEVNKFDLPAGVALITGNVDVAVPDSEAVNTVNDDFFNHLDASFTSPLVGSSYRHIFGTRGLTAQASRYVEFDVVRDISKAEQELSKVTVLGLFAAKAVKDHVNAHKALPQDQLIVHARAGLALPIDEYRSHRVPYAASFEQGTHLVTVRNFETPVTVKIVFDDVQVAAEGSSAQFAIVSGGEKLATAMLKEVRARGYELDGITGADVHSAKNVVGIDIGEGTVNFPVYTQGLFNTDASRTFNEGYGTVLLRSMDALSKAGTPFKSRKKLAEYLLREPSPMKRAEYDTVAGIVAEQAQLWTDQLVQEFSKVFADVRYDAEVAYVYGGGAGPLRETLHEKLMTHVSGSFPVLYLDPEYSRHLNREGLLIAAERVEAAQRSK